jgi:hypothetical protein
MPDVTLNEAQFNQVREALDEVSNHHDCTCDEERETLQDEEYTCFVCRAGGALEVLNEARLRVKESK